MTHELPQGWDLHQEQLHLYRNDERFQQAVAQETKRAGEASLAFRFVRDVRARKVMSGLPFTTGFEGYFAGYYSPEEIVRRERELGQHLDAKVKRLEPNLRREVRHALEETAYTPAAVAWLDAELGATIGRLRALYSTTGYNEQARRENIAFRDDTYHALSVLPDPVRKIETVFSDPSSLVVVEYPFPSDVRGEDEATEKLEQAELYLRALGNMGLPALRVLAGQI